MSVPRTRAKVAKQEEPKLFDISDAAQLGSLRKSLEGIYNNYAKISPALHKWLGEVLNNSFYPYQWRDWSKGLATVMPALTAHDIAQLARIPEFKITRNEFYPGVTVKLELDETSRKTVQQGTSQGGQNPLAMAPAPTTAETPMPAEVKKAWASLWNGFGLNLADTRSMEGGELKKEYLTERQGEINTFSAGLQGKGMNECYNYLFNYVDKLTNMKKDGYVVAGMFPDGRPFIYIPKESINSGFARQIESRNLSTDRPVIVTEWPEGGIAAFTGGRKRGSAFFSAITEYNQLNDPEVFTKAAAGREWLMLSGLNVYSRRVCNESMTEALRLSSQQDVKNEVAALKPSGLGTVSSLLSKHRPTDLLTIEEYNLLRKMLSDEKYKNAELVLHHGRLIKFESYGIDETSLDADRKYVEVKLPGDKLEAPSSIVISLTDKVAGYSVQGYGRYGNNGNFARSLDDLSQSSKAHDEGVLLLPGMFPIHITGENSRKGGGLHIALNDAVRKLWMRHDMAPPSKQDYLDAGMLLASLFLPIDTFKNFYDNPSLESGGIFALDLIACASMYKGVIKGARKLHGLSFAKRVKTLERLGINFERMGVKAGKGERAIEAVLRNPELYSKQIQMAWDQYLQRSIFSRMTKKKAMQITINAGTSELMRKARLLEKLPGTLEYGGVKLEKGLVASMAKGEDLERFRPTIEKLWSKYGKQAEKWEKRLSKRVQHLSLKAAGEFMMRPLQVVSVYQFAQGLGAALDFEGDYEERRKKIAGVRLEMAKIWGVLGAANFLISAPAKIVAFNKAMKALLGQASKLKEANVVEKISGIFKEYNIVANAQEILNLAKGVKGTSELAYRLSPVLSGIVFAALIGDAFWFKKVEGFFEEGKKGVDASIAREAANPKTIEAASGRLSSILTVDKKTLEAGLKEKLKGKSEAEQIEEAKRIEKNYNAATAIVKDEKGNEQVPFSSVYFNLLATSDSSLPRFQLAFEELAGGENASNLATVVFADAAPWLGENGLADQLTSLLTYFDYEKMGDGAFWNAVDGFSKSLLQMQPAQREEYVLELMRTGLPGGKALPANVEKEVRDAFKAQRSEVAMKEEKVLEGTDYYIALWLLQGKIPAEKFISESKPPIAMGNGGKTSVR